MVLKIGLDDTIECKVFFLKLADLNLMRLIRELIDLALIAELFLNELRTCL